MSDNFKGYTVVDPTPAYNKALMDSFKSFGIGIKNNVNSYLDKLGTQEGMTEEALGASNLGGVAGTFIGKKAKEFLPEMEELAATMKAAGASVEDIWKATGVRRWASGARQEISDQGLKFKPDATKLQSGKLGDIVEHSEYFKNYPELANIRVMIDSKMPAGNANIIPGLTPYGTTMRISQADVDAGNVESILHEMQHAVQAREGWQGGDSYHDRIMALVNKGIYPTKEEQLKIWDEYATVPGEYEAMNTVNRLKLTDQQRKELTPDFTGKFSVKDMHDRHIKNYKR